VEGELARGGDVGDWRAQRLTKPGWLPEEHLSDGAELASALETLV
jgi:hypothetical protein